MTFPVIDRPAPEGHEWVWAAEPAEGWHAWKAVRASEARTCRATGCKHLSVAAMDRRWRDRPSWWHYCADHMFGRIVVHGLVYGKKLVKSSAGAPLAPSTSTPADCRDNVAGPSPASERAGDVITSSPAAPGTSTPSQRV